MGPVLPRFENFFAGSVMPALTAASIRVTWVFVTDSFMWMMLEPTESDASSLAKPIPSCISMSHCGENCLTNAQSAVAVDPVVAVIDSPTPGKLRLRLPSRGISRVPAARAWGAAKGTTISVPFASDQVRIWSAAEGPESSSP